MRRIGPTQGGRPRPAAGAGDDWKLVQVGWVKGGFRVGVQAEGATV